MIEVPARDFSITSEEVGISRAPTLSGKLSQRQRGNNHRWILTIKTPPLNTKAGQKLNAALVALRGTKKTTVPYPAINYSAVNSANVLADTNKGATQIVFTGVPANTTDCLFADTKIQFASHSKVYNLDLCADSNAQNQVTATITPALMQDISGGEVVTIGRVMFVVIKDETSETFNYSVGTNSTKTVKLLEDI